MPGHGYYFHCNAGYAVCNLKRQVCFDYIYLMWHNYHFWEFLVSSKAFKLFLLPQLLIDVNWIIFILNLLMDTHLLVIPW